MPGPDEQYWVYDPEEHPDDKKIIEELRKLQQRYRELKKLERKIEEADREIEELKNGQ